MSCLYRNCAHNRFENDCSFRPFPSNDCQFKIWKRYASCTQTDFNRSEFPSICSCHFIPENENPLPNYEYQSMKRKQLNEEPAKELVQKSVDEIIDNSLNAKRKYHKIYHSKHKREQVECSKMIIYEDLVNVQNENESAKVKSEKIDDFSVFEIVELGEPPSAGHYTEILQPSEAVDSKDDVICTSDLIEREIIEIKDDPPPPSDDFTEPTFGYETIEKSDEEFFTYTGLASKAMFDSIFVTLSQLEFNYVAGWNVNKIPMKNQLLMTLMKMRMNLRYNQIAELFNCSEATISNIVRSWMVAMQDIIFLHEMKNFPTEEKKSEELSACRMIEDMLQREIEKAMKLK